MELQLRQYGRTQAGAGRFRRLAATLRRWWGVGPAGALRARRQQRAAHRESVRFSIKQSGPEINRILKNAMTPTGNDTTPVSLYSALYEVARIVAELEGLFMARRYIMAEHVQGPFLRLGVVPPPASETFARLLAFRQAFDRRETLHADPEEVTLLAEGALRFGVEADAYLRRRGFMLGFDEAGIREAWAAVGVPAAHETEGA